MSQNKIKLLRQAYFILIWLLCWELMSLIISNRLILAGPITSFQVLIELVQDTSVFWPSIFRSFLKIGVGYLIGTGLAFILAFGAHRFPVWKELFAPVIFLMQSIPVASFVIIALIWVGSERLSVLISMLVVLPMVYEHTLSALLHRPVNMLEMAEIFRIRRLRRFRYITLPAIRTQVGASMSQAYSLAWKAGVAAELIVVPRKTIGEALYYAKVYFETGEVFAWTFVILILCGASKLIFQTVFSHFLDRLTGVCFKDKHPNQEDKS